MIVVFAMVARDVDVSRFGDLMIAFGIATVLSGLIDFGAGNYWVREFASGRLSGSQLASRSAGKIVAGGVIGGLLAALSVLDWNSAILFHAGVLLAGSVISQTHQSLLVAARYNFKLTGAVVLERGTFVSVYLAIVAVGQVSSTDAFASAYLIGALGLALFTAWQVPEMRPAYNRITWLTVWSGTAYYGMSASLISLQATDIMIGAATAGPGAAGAYGAVSRWVAPILLATNAFATLLNPVASSAADRTEIWVKVRRALWMPAASVGISVMMVIFADPIVSFVLGEEYAASAAILRVVAIAGGMSVISQVTSTILQARRREKTVAVSLGVSVFVQLSLVAPLAALSGGLGIALALAIGQLTLLAQLATRMIILLRKG